MADVLPLAYDGRDDDTMAYGNDAYDVKHAAATSTAYGRPEPLPIDDAYPASGSVTDRGKDADAYEMNNTFPYKHSF